MAEMSCTCCETRPPAAVMFAECPRCGHPPEAHDGQAAEERRDGIRIEFAPRGGGGYIIATVPVESEYTFPVRIAVGDYRQVSADGEPEVWKAWLWPVAGGAMHVTRSVAAAERPTEAALLETLQQRARKAPWWGQAAAGRVGAEWPAAATEINWELLQDLYVKPHQLIRDADPAGLDKDLHYGFIELLDEAKAVHHLFDMIDVPHGYSLDTRSIDDRALIAVCGMLALRGRLARISGWHARETGPAGTVGDNCAECGQPWVCDTRRMADGAYDGDRAGE
jgi:hypothetical protein